MANFDLTKLMEGKNPTAIMLEQTRGLKNKWEKTGLLEGIDNKPQQHAMAVLLENQAKQLLDEATGTGTAAGSEEWSGVALPLVRRIFGEIAAKEFVSVQPMNLPSGLIFYMDFKYGSAVGDRVKGDSIYGNSGTVGKDSLSPNGNKLGSTQSPTGGLYGAGKFGYTVNEVSSTIASGSATVAQASSASVNWNANYTATSGLKSVSFTIPAGADYNAVKAFYISGAALPNGYYPEFTTLSGTTLTFIAPGATADGTGKANSAITLKYEAQPTAYNRGDFEDRDPINNGTTVESAGTNLDIPQVDLELKSEAIVAKTRKLKAVWTPELAQDLNAYHSIDAEAELTSMLSEYISLEIDLEILDMLKANALTTEYWSLKVGNEWNGSAFEIDADVAAASAYTRNTWFQTLGTKLNKVSNKIHQLTMRGGANFMVASPDVCTILESIPAFTVSADKDAKQFAAGVTQVGSIANRYTVYKNPYMTENVILMGYKGNNFLETGAVYAPYVPLILTPLVYDPDNFTPRRGVMTRYAKKLVRPEFFGKVVIGDLNLL
jgi:hypothetical protein